jgi:hypothetical protein
MSGEQTSKQAAGRRAGEQASGASLGRGRRSEGGREERSPPALAKSVSSQALVCPAAASAASAEGTARRDRSVADQSVK